jgi:hypothetical protein
MAAMRERRVRPVRVIVSALALCAAVLTARPASAAVPLADSTRVAHWREDVTAFARTLPQRHIRFFWRTQSVVFGRGIDSLSQHIAEMPDYAVVAALIRLGAIADAHTGVQWGDSAAGFHRLPMVVSKFEEGWYVLAADSAHITMLGARLVAIGERDMAGVESALAPYVPHENASWLIDRLADVMTVPELLAASGVTPDPSGARVTIEDSTGARHPIDLSAVEIGKPMRVISYATQKGLPVPLARRSAGSNYWYEYLADSRTLFFRYNRCVEMDTLPFATFARRLFAVLDSLPVQRVIVDLRSNTGGNSEVIAPFRDAILKKRDFGRKDRLFVLIGRRTFSSGSMNAVQLAERATLVGQATGGSMDAYGEVQGFRLPHSGLFVQYSTKFFPMTKSLRGAERNPLTLEPEIAVPLTWSDYRVGLDSTLERAIAGK